jgi:hypothetical protein
VDIERAKELLETLADGIDPRTGELLPADNICNQTEIVRALHTVLRTLDGTPQKAKKPQTENAGKPWGKPDDETLIRMFDNGCSKKEICAYFKRTDGAIAARLVHLGKIDNRDEYRLKSR